MRARARFTHYVCPRGVRDVRDTFAKRNSCTDSGQPASLFLARVAQRGQARRLRTERKTGSEAEGQCTGRGTLLARLHSFWPREDDAGRFAPAFSAGGKVCLRANRDAIDRGTVSIVERERLERAVGRTPSVGAYIFEQGGLVPPWPSDIIHARVGLYPNGTREDFRVHRSSSHSKYARLENS